MSSRKIDQASRELDQSVEQWRVCTARAAERRATLAEVEAGIGGAVLDAEDTDGATRQGAARVAELRASVDVAERTGAAAHSRVLDAQRAVWSAEAIELRAQAAELTRDADRRQRRTHELLAALREHEGCDYEPASERGDPGPDGSRELHNLRQTPETQRVRAQARRLEEQAAAIEVRRIPDHGAVTHAKSLDDLLAQVEAHGPAAVIPTASDVRGWAAEAELPHRQRIARASSTGAPVDVGLADHVAYSLTWQHGRIDSARSRAWVPERSGTTAKGEPIYA